MRRVRTEPRANFVRLVHSQGLVFNRDPLPEGQHEHYWPDNRYYAFNNEDIRLLANAAADVFAMLSEATDHIIEHPELITGKLAIPEFCLKQIAQSWKRTPAFGSVYSRFDICFGGLNHPDPQLRVPKFYEINADTPTTLLESASIQFSWLQQTGHGPDQYNDVEEKLVAAWRRNMAEMEKKLGHKPKVHFASTRSREGEDEINTEYLAATCRTAGYETKNIWLNEISLGEDERLYDQDGEHIDVVYKLYPWELIIKEKFAQLCFSDMENVGRRDANGKYTGGTIWIEPPYKLLWTSKAMFAILWELFKNDPRGKWLLPTYLEADRPADMVRYARKPIFARKGAGVTLKDGEETLFKTDASGFGDEGYVVQELTVLPAFKDGKTAKTFYPVIGLWMIDGAPAGIGIREDLQQVTTDCSSFIPNVIEDAPEVNYERMPVPTIGEIEAVLSLETYYESGVLKAAA
ncbi:hypothetical protein PspLS_09239 [Pyricularia sp. CBS 133598]|nr:hypothetical protein PspLS_09239 [Pyricularia sp. CBS 133598]